MDSQTTPPAAPGPSAAILHNALIDEVKGNEFSNSAGDILKFVMNNNFTAKEGEKESSDIINLLRDAVLPFLTEIRKNQQSQSTVAETTCAVGSNDDLVPKAIATDRTLEDNQVDIIDIVPPDPSSLPVVNIADRYTRSMLKCLIGYPLYDPKPFSELSKEYLRNGVNVGDVGFNTLINPPKLPDGFSLETLDHLVTRNLEPFPRSTSLFPSPITKTTSSDYMCEGSEGAILELPEGAIQDEATNKLPFSKLAARHGVQWYKYTMSRGREISNGSLYLITSFTKCAHWGIAVFDRPCAPGQSLRFDKKRVLPFGKSTSKYHFKGSGAFLAKVSNLNHGDAINQCVFLRGYKIMIRPDIFHNLCDNQSHGSHRSHSEIPSSPTTAEGITMTRHKAQRIRGGGGADPMSMRAIGEGFLSRSSRTTISTYPITTTKSDEVVLHDNFNSSLIHPSDLINAALLSQNPGSKVALTHDDVWCDLLRENFPILNHARLMNIARSYTSRVDEYDCVCLEKISDSNVRDKRSYPVQGSKVSIFPKATVESDVVTPASLSEKQHKKQKIDQGLVAILEALNSVDTTRVPLIQSGFSTAARIFEISQKVKANQDEFIEFAEEGCRLVYSISLLLADKQEIKPNQKANLKELVATLKSIEAFGEMCAARGTVKAVLMHGFDLNEIKVQRLKLGRCMRLFKFRSLLELREKTNHLVEQYGAKNQKKEILTKHQPPKNITSFGENTKS